MAAELLAGVRTKAARDDKTIVTWQIDPRVGDIIDRAQREHHRITLCELCGGPRIHSKVRPQSKCFRCGDVRISASILPFPAKQKCRRCKSFHWSVIRTLYCKDCREKVTSRGGPGREVAEGPCEGQKQG